MTTMEVADDVKTLVETTETLELVTIDGANDAKLVRVKCSATGHEMPPRVDVITAHLNSKRYKKATEWYSFDFSQYEPYIVSHRRKPKCLYCNVTGLVLNKIPSEIEKHMKGKKFLRLKEEVKFLDDAEADKGDDDFDANKFEFFNRQIVDSDADDDDDEGASKKRKAADEGIGEEFYEGLPPVSDDEEEDDEDEDEVEDAKAKKPSAKANASPAKGFQKVTTKPAPKKAAPAKRPKKST
ncbi:hypothetical protein SPRG_02879 [Saprolegnia parasitica CBS 223.65]|uniref:Surfeit locus protein 2 n=1 Tax=Saprolegnia parasitica (strain CBS 223.65) TaxID=695850 RepID=A0A067D023_SAPPC|nr:hypothetical protein SPRG_02879 [Saprolegnia parasitica CBS 223.65]KDO32402.1 hypothetical protein SPRG_02879 [Saprolegnia parasitica CBS 223.65]|eukprot:XP_012196856.1 hypothetical protein SPRG_02879 [Saprolegnia parasitica CBS 223.65]